MLNPDQDIDIFMSYASRRRKAAEHLARTLESYGYNVWFDYKLIEGRDFAFQLDERLRSAKLTVVMWCRLSVDSRWVHEEADLAESMGRLLPLKMENCELKLGTRRLQYEDLIEWDGSPTSGHLDGLLRAAQRMTGKPPTINHDALEAVEQDWDAIGQPTFSEFPIAAQRDSDKRTWGKSTSGHIEERLTENKFSNSTPTRSTTAAHSLIEPGHLTIGMFPYPPLNCGDEPGNMTGPWAELASALAAGLGLTPKFKFTSFSDLLKNAYSTVDVVVAVFDTERRRTYFNFARPINRVALLGLCREEFEEIHEDDIRKGRYRILVQEAEVGWEFMHDEAPKAIEMKRMVSVDAVNAGEVLQMLKLGRFDLALIDAVSCQNFLKDEKLSQGLRLAFDIPLNMFDSGVAIRRTSGLDVDQINELVTEIRNRPHFRALEAEALQGYERIVKRVGLR